MTTATIGEANAVRIDVEIDADPRPLAAVFAEISEPSGGSDLRLRLFRPAAAVSVGRDQAIVREVRLDWCRDHDVAVTRRPTGGGALWLDPGQQALILDAPLDRLGADPAARLATGGRVLERALARLGVAAAFVAPNDLQVAGGAKVGSVFLAETAGRATLFATVLVDFDLRAAMSALLVPTEKLTVTGLEHARERVTTLMRLRDPCPSWPAIVEALIAACADEFGADVAMSRRGADVVAAPSSEAVDPWAAAPVEGYETEERTARATLRLRLALAADGETVRDARFATDAAHVPSDLAARIAEHLVGVAVDMLPEAMTRCLRSDDLFVGLGAVDLVRLALRARDKHRLARRLGLDDAHTSGLKLAGPGVDEGRDVGAALAGASVVLVPYCAKPAWCALRPTPDCIECGHCEVGEAYRAARERGLEVTTILNFEHLAETLAEMRGRGVTSYVGMCCADFFLKRHAAFREAGMDAVLMDIVGATCYALDEEHLAYAGTFKAEAALDLDAFDKVIAAVPGRVGNDVDRGD